MEQKMTLEAVNDGFLQLNASYQGHAPIVFTKKGQKHTFETYGMAKPYLPGIESCMKEGMLKVSGAEEAAKSEMPKAVLEAQAKEEAKMKEAEEAAKAEVASAMGKEEVKPAAAKPAGKQKK